MDNFFRPRWILILNQGRRLSGRTGRSRDAQTIELHEADHALLRRLQPPKQLVQRGSADRGTFVILDCDVFVERERAVARRIAHTIDPFIAGNRRDPGAEGLRGRKRVAFRVNGQEHLLPRIVGGGIGKPARVVGPKPQIQLPQQSLICVSIPCSRRKQKPAPSLRTIVPSLPTGRLPAIMRGKSVSRRGRARPGSSPQDDGVAIEDVMSSPESAFIFEGSCRDTQAARSFRTAF